MKTIYEQVLDGWIYEIGDYKSISARDALTAIKQEREIAELAKDCPMPKFIATLTSPDSNESLFGFGDTVEEACKNLGGFEESPLFGDIEVRDKVFDKLLGDLSENA
jgi:hypothetical protein